MHINILPDWWHINKSKKNLVFHALKYILHLVIQLNIINLSICPSQEYQHRLFFFFFLNQQQTVKYSCKLNYNNQPEPTESSKASLRTAEELYQMASKNHSYLARCKARSFPTYVEDVFSRCRFFLNSVFHKVILNLQLNDWSVVFMFAQYINEKPTFYL